MTKESHKELALMSITSVLTGVEAAQFFSAKLPSTMTIKAFVDKPELMDAIYDGLVKANIGAAIMAGIITIASYYAKIRYWWLPAAATTGVCGFMTWSYLDDLKQSPAYKNNNKPQTTYNI